MLNKEEGKRSSRCGPMGSAASLELWDMGSISVWHSGLRTSSCCSCGIGHSCGSDLIPGWGTPYASGWQKEKKKKKRQREIATSEASHLFWIQFGNVLLCHNPKEVKDFPPN